MKYPRVNLLKKSEKRYQGVVSHRFLLVSIIVTPILIITIFSGIKLIQYTSVRSSIKTNNEIWNGLKPRLALYKEEQRSLAANKRALVLIAKWKDEQVPLSQLLNEIQDSVPGGIQFTRLAIRGERNANSKSDPDDFTLNYSLTVQGLSMGERAEDAVIGLRKDLLRPDLMKAMFDSVELGYMRKRSGKSGQVGREFSLEGLSSTGDGQ